jgi:hypothetical protein
MLRITGRIATNGLDINLFVSLLLHDGYSSEHLSKRTEAPATMLATFMSAGRVLTPHQSF